MPSGRAVDVLGLFPFSDGSVGGVQTSGRAAWAAVTNHDGRCGSGSTCSAHLFVAGDALTAPAGGRNGPVRQAAAKIATVARVARARCPARCVLVWHLGLLKLLPFLRLPDARVIVFLHGIEAWRRQDWLTRRYLPRVDLFLSNSDHTWRRFVALHPEVARTRQRTVPLGIGEPADGSVAAPDRVPMALMLGRLARGEAYKGHRDLIAAWGDVLRHVPDAELWIAGDGDLRPELERWAAGRPWSPHVRFCGLVSEAEKERLLTASRCLALPSRGEGFGLVYLEAMRLGRPCLVSTLDAGQEVVDPPECGLAVDPGNPDAVARALARLLGSGPEWDRWSRQARARYETRFTAAHFRVRLLEGLAALETPAGAPVGRAP
jgi:phosphatidyl-myo-inositol dimannoside synthase